MKHITSNDLLGRITPKQGALDVFKIKAELGAFSFHICGRSEH